MTVSKPLSREQRVVEASLAYAQAGTDPKRDDALDCMHAPTPAIKAPSGAERQR